MGIAITVLAFVVPGPALAATGTVAPAGSIRNPHDPSHWPTSPNNSNRTGLLSDPANGVLLSYNVADCPEIYRLDIDSGAVKTDSGMTSCHGSLFAPGGTGGSEPLAALDPQDRLLLGADMSDQQHSVSVVSELTLKPVARWSMPLPGLDPTAVAGLTIVGVSWFARDDSLLVLTNTNGGSSGPPGVAVTAFSIPLSLRAGTGVVLWTYTISPAACPYTLSAETLAPAAYHLSAAPAVILGCNRNHAPGANYVNDQYAVVKFPLGPKDHNGNPCPAPATECPTGGPLTVSVVPASAQDLVFDSGSDRAFLFTKNPTVALLVYDGRQGIVEGSAKIGDSASDTNRLALAFDPESGRFYSLGKGQGLTLIDGRRTPVSPGAVFPQYARTLETVIYPVLPPDGAHPYRRVLFPSGPGLDTQSSGMLTAFSVFADTVPVTTDPPAAAVDSSTFSGQIPAGAQVTSVYGGTARGYGYHSVLVGGVNGSTFDLEGGNYGTVSSVPFGRTNNLLGASVSDLSVRNGNPHGRSSAAEDGNATTAEDLQRCTDPTQSIQCTGRPDCAAASLVPGGSPVPCPPLPATAPPPPGTTAPQSWPFASVDCPAQDGSAKASTSGYSTTQADGSSQQVAGSDTQAGAAVDCGLNPAITANASIQGVGPGGSAGVPLVQVGSGSVSGTITPPTGAAGVSVQTTAVADGVTVSLPTGSFSIGEVRHTATATAAGSGGSARTTESLTISRFSIGGTEECQQCDPQLVAQQISNAFPGQILAEIPPPDDTHAKPCTGDRLTAAGATCFGSPGGYLAAIQAGLDQRLGDTTFNEMTEAQASMLPGLRIVAYGLGEGRPTRSRQVTDLAGVDVDAERGISVLPLATAGDFAAITPVAAAIAAGVPTTQIVPGVPGIPATTGGGGGGFAQRVLQGIRSLLRSPLG
ncbi:MAG TPA: hypothetical protein VG245_01170, partial [Candidatus Dormibacteraeota bacterium]|nr:hypothetical protein [Candidatus Dormibacteraeota bacterium]